MKYKIKYLDGLKIRNTLDVDFGVIGSSKIYNYIPEGEIWLDKLYIKEKEHFLKIHLAELKLMERMSYEQARKIIEKKFVETGKTPDFVVKQKKYKEFILKYLDGRIVRKFIDPKFILGCHGSGLGRHKLSKYIKNNEIWLDIRQDKKELRYTLIHEYEEAKLMKKGMKYQDAHDFALVYEKIARRKDGAKYLKD